MRGERGRPVPVDRRGAREAPLPGLRAVLYSDRALVLFIVDTRSLSLTERGMQVPTTMGLDLTRAEFLRAVAEGGRFAPATGLGAVVFAP